MVVLASINLLSVVLFIVALGLLVSIHELGHLITAKIFKVYCFEFSIGFGPKLFQKRGKGGETDYSIRAIPLGGYVSMFGETETIPEGVEVAPERSLLAIAKWKRAIIMSAGVILNFVLGFVLMLCNTLFFPQVAYTNQVSVSEVINDETSEAYQAGLRTGDAIVGVTTHYLKDGLISDEYTPVTYEVTTYEDLWDKALVVSTLPTSEKDKLNITLTWIAKEDINKDNPATTSHTFTLTSSIVNSDSEEVVYSWSKMGIGAYQTRLSFGKAFVRAGQDFWDAATAIAKALGQLFVGKGFDQIGGPVAILTTSATALEVGFGTYLWLWGMISVNLGIFNLLPFPGLDGWHLFVVIVEGITKKEIPSKVKNIVSLVGMIILFAFMGFILIKDVIGLF